MVVFCLVAILMIWNSLFKDISDDLQTFQQQPKLFIKKILIPFVLLSPVSLLLSVFSLNIFFAFFAVSYSTLSTEIVSFYSLKFYIIGLFLGLIPLFPRLLTLFKGKKIDVNLTSNYLAILLILFYFELCGVYLGQFAKYIYPKVPEQFGGGELRKVRILFAKDRADAIKQNSIPTCSSGNVLSNWSKPVSLLFEGSEKYLLRLEDKRPPIQLYKRNVDVVEPILKTYNSKQKPIECPYTYTDKNIEKKIVQSFRLIYGNNTNSSRTKSFIIKHQLATF